MYLQWQLSIKLNVCILLLCLGWDVGPAVQYLISPGAAADSPIAKMDIDFDNKRHWICTDIQKALGGINLTYVSFCKRGR